MIEPDAPANDTQPVPPNELVWRVCRYTHPRQTGGCKRCPAFESHPRYGRSSRLCYLLAREVVNIVQTGSPWRE